MHARPLAWLQPLVNALSAGCAAATAPARVLVVDDEETICRFVARVMTEAGCDVITATSGADAIVIAERESIDLLITDVMVPAMNGDELVRRLRQRDGDLPVLYLTGLSDRLFEEGALLWDHEAFLEKPCSAKGLLEAAALVSGGQLAGTLSGRPRAGAPEAAVGIAVA